MRTPLTLALTLALCGACTHWHLERSAPGHVDVLAPPTVSASGYPERPSDPGERMFIVSPGVLAGTGLAQGGKLGTRGYASLTAELGLHLGSSPASHVEDRFLGPIPMHAIGLNFDLSFFDSDHAGLQAGPGSFQLQRC